MQEVKVKQALEWITDLLKSNKIPFQIAGGLAVKVYGGIRDLNDIDIFLPMERFNDVEEDVRPYIVMPPTRYKDDEKENIMCRINYNGQKIELADSDKLRIFDKRRQQWVEMQVDLSNSSVKEIFGVRIPVMRRSQLIEYKSALRRNFDEQDIKEIA